MTIDLLRVKWLIVGILALLPYTSNAATVNVLGEAHLTASTLTVDIFATTADKILSFGIKLSYCRTDLSITSVERSNDVWYFGNTSTKYPYIAPNSSVEGQVIIVGGLLETTNPTAGVTGQRIPLATVNFDRLTASAPALSLTYAKSSPYKNFVSTAGTIYDDAIEGVEFRVLFDTPCQDCSGDPVELSGVTFAKGVACVCSATTFISIGPNVTIESGANITFRAPKVNVKSAFKAEEGAVVKIEQE